MERDVRILAIAKIMPNVLRSMELVFARPAIQDKRVPVTVQMEVSVKIALRSVTVKMVAIVRRKRASVHARMVGKDPIAIDLAV